MSCVELARTGVHRALIDRAAATGTCEAEVIEVSYLELPSPSLRIQIPRFILCFALLTLLPWLYLEKAICKGFGIDTNVAAQRDAIVPCILRLQMYEVRLRFCSSHPFCMSSFSSLVPSWQSCRTTLEFHPSPKRKNLHPPLLPYQHPSPHQSQHTTSPSYPINAPAGGRTDIPNLKTAQLLLPLELRRNRCSRRKAR